MFRNYERGGETSGELTNPVKGWSGSLQPLLVGGKTSFASILNPPIGKEG
jgi:hypothetical protein